jgi:hypothetical protein
MGTAAQQYEDAEFATQQEARRSCMNTPARDHDREDLENIFKKWGRLGEHYQPLIESLLTWKTTSGPSTLATILVRHPSIEKIPEGMTWEVLEWRNAKAAERLVPRNVGEVIANRQGTHGVFKETSVTIQNIKDEMRRSPNWLMMKEYHREALDMLAHKIGRILHGDPDFCDHWDDIAGYAQRVSKTNKGDLSP